MPLNQIPTVRGLTKESNKMNSTETSWALERRKKNSRLLSKSRKKKSDQKSRQSMSLNQILTVRGLTKESNKMNPTETSWTPE